MSRASKPEESVGVAIVGGGIGGLAAASFLRARGFAPVVYESRARGAVEEATRFGNGIHLYFHCARMLLNAGIPLAQDLTPLDIQMRRDDGRLRTDIRRDVQLALAPELSVTRASVYSLLRQRLYGALVEHTPEEDLRCDKVCVGAEPVGEKVRVDFDDGSSVSADLVIGADGIHSVLADQLHGPRILHKHDIVILQGMSTYAELPPLETWVLHRSGGTMGLVPVVLPSGEPGTFWWITVPLSELEALGGPDLESWRTIAGRYAWEAVPPVVEATIPGSIERWCSQDKDPLSQWVRGRTALLGDACHAANPFSGYGAGMSVEDGWWLAELLGAPDILEDRGRLDAALAGYERKRAPFTARVVKDARVLMRVLHPRSRLAAGGLNTAWDSGLAGKLVARKFTAVFSRGLVDTRWTPSEQSQGRLDY